MIKIISTLLTMSLMTYANSFALIVGVDGGDLKGTTNDAKEMSTLLNKKKVKQITTLINEEATKEAILLAFQEIVEKATKKDKVYLFFSGHGTNGYDYSTNNKELRLQFKQRETGALLPYGVKKLSYDSLLVIKDDLAPFFQALDGKKVQTMIMFDACFSGSSYKNTFNTLPKKLTTEFDEYPYKHIVFLSSSTKLQASAELKEENRGYFSMTLTQCLTTNKSFNSLKECIIENYPFTPTILPKEKKMSIF